jgi:hypothetical protein
VKLCAGESAGVRVFLSFDLDHDQDLGDRFAQQSQRGGSGFHVASHSEPGQMTPRWHDDVRRRVRAADEVIVICGEHTAGSDRVHAEMRIAQEEHKPCLLLWGRRERMCSMPLGVKRTAVMHAWTWERVIYLVPQTLREAKPLEIPDDCKRLS